MTNVAFSQRYIFPHILKNKHYKKFFLPVYMCCYHIQQLMHFSRIFKLLFFSGHKWVNFVLETPTEPQIFENLLAQQA